tara:strand:- start:33 stop:311 length:279 start_codon:yes stop_codon:yes gene_type:complete
MLYILFCEDKADSLELRLANRKNHLSWASEKASSIKLAGPMLSDDGETMIGSVFILEASSIEEVRTLNTEDPYTKAGLWQKVIIHPFRQSIP